MLVLYSNTIKTMGLRLGEDGLQYARPGGVRITTNQLVFGLNLQEQQSRTYEAEAMVLALISWRTWHWTSPRMRARRGRRKNVKGRTRCTDPSL